jgi:hypothetical protein
LFDISSPGGDDDLPNHLVFGINNVEIPGAVADHPGRILKPRIGVYVVGVTAAASRSKPAHPQSAARTTVTAIFIDLRSMTVLLESASTTAD